VSGRAPVSRWWPVSLLLAGCATVLPTWNRTPAMIVTAPGVDMDTRHVFVCAWRANVAESVCWVPKALPLDDIPGDAPIKPDDLPEWRGNVETDDLGSDPLLKI